MPGNAAQTKVFYKGKEEDFVVFADSAKAVEDWKKDRSIPLAQVVNGFKIFITHKYVVCPAAPLLSSVRRLPWSGGTEHDNGIGFKAR